MPGKVALHQTSEPQLKGEFDEWLSRVVCFAFSISPQALIKQMNRASADTQKELAEEEGLAPLLDWIKAVLDDVIADDFGAPELEFAWQEDEQIDEAKQAERLRGLTAGGLMRLNEGRKILGLNPDPSPAADVLMVMTGAGLVPIDANTLAGKKAALDAFGPPPGANGFGSSGQAAEEQDDGPSDPVAKLLGKFDEAQPRDARGRWTDGSAGGEAGEAAERAAFKRTVLRTAIGGAVIAGGAIVTAATGGGTVPAAVEAAVWIAENYLLGDALVTAGRHIGAHLGYDDEEVAHMLDHLAGAVGFGKASGNAAAGERIRDRLSEVVVAALDAMIAAVRDAGLDADRRDAIVAALEDLRGRLTARIAHLPAPAHKAAAAELTKGRCGGRPIPSLSTGRPRAGRCMRLRSAGESPGATRSNVIPGLRGLFKLSKVGPEPDDADALRRALDAYLDDFDFADLRAAAPEVADELEAVAADAGRRALAQIGAASREELVDRVNTRAVAAARARAAEMVGMRFDADGRLVPSADARMVITEANARGCARPSRRAWSATSASMPSRRRSRPTTPSRRSAPRASPSTRWPAPTARRRWRATGWRPRTASRSARHGGRRTAAARTARLTRMPARSPSTRRFRAGTTRRPRIRPAGA